MGSRTEYQRVYSYTRRAKNDRIEFDVPKGGKTVLEAVAMKHGMKMNMVLRKLLLGAAGLKKWPDDETVEMLRMAVTQQEAKAALAEAARREKGA